MANGLVVRRVKPPELRQGRFSSLGLYVKDSGERLVLSVQYVRDRFPQAAIESLVQDLLTVVSRLVSNPGCKALPLLETRYAGSPSLSRNQMAEFVRLPTEVAEAWGLTSGIAARSQPL